MENHRTFYCTPSGCSCKPLYANTFQFRHSGLVVVSQKCRIAKPVRKRNDFQVQIYENSVK